MASAPEESGAGAELQQLKPQDDDFNPFSEEGKNSLDDDRISRSIEREFDMQSVNE